MSGSPQSRRGEYGARPVIIGVFDRTGGVCNMTLGAYLAACLMRDESQKAAA
jgi:hypothetical protein